MIRTSIFLLFGNSATALLAFVRNLVIARLLSLEDFGVATTFAIAVTLVELVSDLGVRQQIVQSTRDDDEWLAGLHGFQVLRGVGAAIILFLSADLISQFLNLSDLAWAFAVVSIVPFLNSYINLDIYRQTRRLKFRSMITTSVAPSLISLACIWPLYLFFEDYRVMLFAILIQSLAAVLTSNLLANSRFTIQLRLEVLKDAFYFGWPLLANGLFLFITLYGERIIVGRELGMAQLAIFGMGITLTLTPTRVISQSINDFFLPQLSAAKEQYEKFRPLYYTVIEMSILNGALILVGVILFGDELVAVLLGPRYQALADILIWLAILHAIRAIKPAGAVISMSRGWTANAMAANSFRVAYLPIAWWIAVETGDLLLLIWGAIVAEGLGTAVSIALARHRTNIGLFPVVSTLSLMAALLLVGALIAATPGTFGTATIPQWMLVTMSVLLFFAIFWSMKETRLLSAEGGQGPYRFLIVVGETQEPMTDAPLFIKAGYY